MAATWAQQAGSVLRRSRTRTTAGVLLTVSGTVCAVLVFIAVFGGWLAPDDPDAVDLLSAGSGLGGHHLLGADSLGRDILSRALVGARLSFAGPGTIVLISAGVGTALAVAAAWHGGWLDRVLNRVLTLMFSIPGLLVAVLAAAVFGTGFWAPVLALSLVYVPYVARVVRSVAVRERGRPYVESLLLSGVPAWRVAVRHLLPNLAPIVLAQATFAFGAALVDFAAVSFLGLGIQAPQAEWGVMVADGSSEILDGALQQSLTAGLLIVVTVVTFNILGEQLTSRFGDRR